MDFYVSNNAIEELNTCGTTKILDENGKGIGGHISVSEGRPRIVDLFGCDEIICLDSLRLYDDGLRGWLTTHDCEQFIQFNFFHNDDHFTAWTYKE